MKTADRGELPVTEPPPDEVRDCKISSVDAIMSRIRSLPSDVREDDDGEGESE